MTEPLYIYTVYDHPTDYPDHFVVRQFSIGVGAVIPRDAWQFKSLAGARQFLYDRGLVCLPRSEGDDPKIVESWI